MIFDIAAELAVLLVQPIAAIKISPVDLSSSSEEIFTFKDLRPFSLKTILPTLLGSDLKRFSSSIYKYSTLQSHLIVSSQK